ncbi:serine/threonine-protein kinase [Nonomuraea africana]|uniref:Ser/Thr protein kinase n=1 Tax=Nonomuraea africana TaxID=46171 RepID=A0ABR9KSM5_9ACTN|nr:serine/threonine-protein kinase [Nonomuraea africana]MBE1565029.1 putative Ser/Thr protein kinase [Nonomuraea africana]
MPHSHPHRPGAGAWTAAVAWAAVPFLTCGMATPFSIGFAAYWLQSKALIVAAALYGTCVSAFVLVALSYDDVELAPDWLFALVGLGLLISWAGGVIHSGILVPLMVRRGRPAHHFIAGHGGPAHGRPGHGHTPGLGRPAGRGGPIHDHTGGRPVHNRATVPTGAARRPGEPEWIGHYRVLRSLGRGGQGAVYLAAAPNGTQVAVKVLHDLGDEFARNRFAREVDAARRVATFSTARLLDVNISPEHAYIVSEYVAGPSLEQLVRTHGPRDEDSLTRLALSTVGALAAIHKAGVVHRDFKPSNVLIGSDGPRVIDFGIARSLDSSTMTGKVAGTPPYMSPEQLSGSTVGPPSDVFSWAVTMTFAATGRPAFGEDTVPAVFNRVLNLHPDLSSLPPSLRGIVGAALAKTPSDRPTASAIMLAIVD